MGAYDSNWQFILRDQVKVKLRDQNSHSLPWSISEKMNVGWEVELRPGSQTPSIFFQVFNYKMVSRSLAQD